jgi:hypothetical protein
MRPYDALVLVGVQDRPQVSEAVVSKALARLRRQGAACLDRSMAVSEEAWDPMTPVRDSAGRRSGQPTVPVLDGP